MAKKLSDITQQINSSSQQFIEYLRNNLNNDVLNILKRLEKETSVLIFSGIIRNFFLGVNEIRDIDIVLSKRIDINPFFSNAIIEKNSFGGYKIKINNSVIDLWYLADTWAFKFQKNLGFELEKYIAATSFFNFSSICFSLNEEKFYYTEHFVRFLRDKQIDVVFKPNFNYSLCIVNTLYYSKKYSFHISKNLSKYLKIKHKSNSTSYIETQKKHFGRIIFSPDEIENFIKVL
ncbi:hypothetical protein ACT29H_07935 [Thermophagus sp. OGC60D27]|uniref:hypothetical protein n=1 Tax=Thermophagus sp. OGC60D27 TaxID=3458415 RepID=UPI004037973A